MRFFHVTIIWSGDSKPPSQLKGILDLAADWFAFGNSFYVICTTDAIYEWQQRFIAVIDAQRDFLIISEIKDVQTDVGGWMRVEFWEWLRRNRFPNPPTFPIPQFLPPSNH